MLHQLKLKSSLNLSPKIASLISFTAGSLIFGLIGFRSSRQAEQRYQQALAQHEFQYEELNTRLSQLNDYKMNHQYQLIDDCSGKKCLYRGDEAVEGLGYLTGYYSTVEKTIWGEATKCDVLVVVDGHEELIGDLKDWVQRGNSVNEINSEGNLVINLSLDTLTPAAINQIKNSSPTNKVQLMVVRITPQPRGASSCTSFVDIIAVGADATTSQ